MPITPHLEKHFRLGRVRDMAIGMADGLFRPCGGPFRDRVLDRHHCYRWSSRAN
jgi:hypothetical protein